MTEPNGVATSYTYNALNLLTNATQSADNKTLSRDFTYNTLSQLVSATNPETGRICYGYLVTVGTGGGNQSTNCSAAYDARGNLQAKTDARGITITYSYDLLDRLTAKATGGTVYAAFGYDGKDEGGGPVPNASNSVGRLSRISSIGPPYFGLGYDALGRQVSQNHCFTPGCNEMDTVVQIRYDFAGDPIYTKYPDGREIKGQYNSAGRLISVSDNSNASSQYVSSISYWPSGSPQVITYGNGVTETLTQNSRLQPCEDRVTSSAGTFLDRQYFYGTSNVAGQQCAPVAGNNGNIWNIDDGLGGSYNQSFTYDQLNRLKSWTAPNMAGAYQHLDYLYDSFGNLVQSNSGTGYDAAGFYNSRNQLQGWWFQCTGLHGETGGYDAAGNTLCGGTQNTDAQAFVWDPESRITQVWRQQNNNTYNQVAAYSYDALGQRVRSDTTGNNWRQYVYFGGQVLAELDQAGKWTDYVYANGKKIARLGQVDHRVRLSGHQDSSWEGGVGGIHPPDGIYAQSGDRVCWRQYNDHAVGGMMFGFSSGSTAWQAFADDGQQMNQDYIQGGWQRRCGNIPSFLYGGLFNEIEYLHDVGSPNGDWTILIADLVYLRANGTVIPLMTPGQVPFVSDAAPYSVGAGGTLQRVVEDVPSASDPYLGNGAPTRTYFYTGDQVGTTALELASGGWPIWRGEFQPFGAELDAGVTTNRYKFTGKERDSESGLDYFGARYYASGLGRFWSPDWSSSQDPIPYAKLANPQSLNLYSYVENNPLSRVDVDGHFSCSGGNAASYGCELIAEWNRAHEMSAAVWKAEGFDVAAPDKQQSGGGGFWQHVGNVLHGHSWNYVRTTVTVTEEYSVKEPTDGVALAADALGMIAATPGLKAPASVALTMISTGASLGNDSGNVNTVINGTNLALGSTALIMEGTAIGAAASGAGAVAAFGAAAWDLDNAFVNHVLMKQAGQANFDRNAPPSSGSPYDYDPDYQ